MILWNHHAHNTQQIHIIQVIETVYKQSTDIVVLKCLIVCIIIEPTKLCKMKYIVRFNKGISQHSWKRQIGTFPVYCVAIKTFSTVSLNNIDAYSMR